MDGIPRENPARPGVALEKLGAVLFIAAMLGATLLPLRENWRAKPADDFPLSYYPMFSAKRSDTYVVHYLIGLDAAGNRTPINYKLIGKSGFNSTRHQINKYIRDNQAAKLGESVARKIAKQSQPPLADVVKVQVVTGTYRIDDYFAGNKTPAKERIRATAFVQRGESR